MKRLTGIYGILPPDLPADTMLAMAAAALKGGVRILQLRDKMMSGKDRPERARALGNLAREYDAAFIVNDDAALASDAQADGVHIGPGDFTALGQVRRDVGENRLIGVSCKGDAEFARRVLENGADYVSFGAVFPTSSKSAAREIGLAGLKRARSALPEANIVAIGGISRHEIAAVRSAGADAAAVISGLFMQQDIVSAAEALVAAWEGA